jgi:hypothetical protein
VETERSVQELINEWYKRYFVGAVSPTASPVNAVTTPDGTVEFLVASLGFQAGPLDFSGPNKAAVHTVISDLRPLRVWQEDMKKHYMTTATITIFARVLNQGNRGQESDFAARRLGDQVRYLFESPSMRADLSRKGVTRCRVVRGPVPQPFPGYQVRIVTVQTILRYSMAIPIQITQSVPGLVQYVGANGAPFDLFNYTESGGFALMSPAEASLASITDMISIGDNLVMTLADDAVTVGSLSADSTEAQTLPRLDFYMDGTRVASLGSDGELATRAFIETDSDPELSPAFIFRDSGGNWLASLDKDGLHASGISTGL